MKEHLIVKGAKEHNLKNIDVKIPRNQFVVLTGLSGSGKSSLAFDTIYAEGQRRYVESLSAYARQFLGQMEKPDVESIEGLSPAISIDQKTTSKNPRSTVGTVTEIYDYLRLLYARTGTPHCPTCHRVISPTTIDQIIDQIMRHPTGTRLQVLAPVIKGKKGTHQKLIESLIKEGYVRARINGDVTELSPSINLDKNKKHSIDVVIDRIVLKDEVTKRLTDSVETALRLAQGTVLIDLVDRGEEQLFNTNFSCPEHGQGIAEMEPRMFSFNAPYGACPACNGLGESKVVDPDLIIPDPTLSIAQGAIAPMSKSSEDSYTISIIGAILREAGYDLHTRICDLPERVRQEILYGTGDRRVQFHFDSRFTDKTEFNRPFEGLVPSFERRYRETSSDYMRAYYEAYMTVIECSTCHGKRLNPEVLAVEVGGKNIWELTTLSVSAILEFLDQVTYPDSRGQVAEQIIKEIVARLNFLKNVGLDYLTLARSASTLSGGESQRIRLATQIGSGLVGVMYILDEPSIGLHQKDNQKLLRALRALSDLGNTLLVVEHDEETIREADYILDLGPGAGEHGGQIVAEGPLQAILDSPQSITGQYLSGVKVIEVPAERRAARDGRFLTIRGARENNLRGVDVSFPIGVMTAVTGVSGSGKSTLVNEILYKEATLRINKSRVRPGKNDGIEGLELIDKIVEIDQSPIGRTPRSNPATYTGVFDMIRDLFAATSEAKQRGYQKGRFSFNVSGGRCEHCKGDGIIKIEMHFLPDVYVMCDVCKGKRYNRETLEVKYKGKSIADVLNMTVEEALTFFENIPRVVRKLQTIYDVGLGYIRLGQPSTQLSGGEAQRIKLATELSKIGTGNTLYILDEPTTGLHTADVHNLIHVLQRLVDNGNTIVVIEHNLDVIKSADYIIDLGPDGGNRGGEVIATGTPEEVARVAGSYTGEFLARMLGEERIAAGAKTSAKSVAGRKSGAGKKSGEGRAKRSAKVESRMETTPAVESRTTKRGGTKAKKPSMK